MQNNHTEQSLLTVRIVLPALILIAAGLAHGFGAVNVWMRDFPLGMSIGHLVNSLGLLIGAYGLWKGEYWSRSFAWVVALIPILEITSFVLYDYAASGEIASGQYNIPWIIAQFAVASTLLYLVSGETMRKRFEEGQRSPWDLKSKAGRHLRLLLLGTLIAVPMMVSVASNAHYSILDWPRTTTYVTAALLAVAALAVFREKTWALLLFIPVALLGLYGSFQSLSSFEFWGNQSELYVYAWYFKRTFVSLTVQTIGSLLILWHTSRLVIHLAGRS